MQSLSGILGPVVTTFDAAGELAADAFRANVRAHLERGLQGIVVAGSTGEAPLLDEDERDRLVEWARAEVPSDRWLVVGAGAESTRSTLRRARRAADRGADAVLVVAPHYFGPTAMSRPVLRAHFQRVADESPVPVVLYNIPKYVHFALEPELVAELAAHGNVVGIKDSSGDATLLGAYLTAQSPDFAVLTGNAAGLADALARGARGGILAAALFAPELALAVLTEGPDADDPQATLTAFGREIVAGMGVPGVKAALDEVGLYGGPPRPPLLPLDASQRARVRELTAPTRATAAA
jgi:4-hydroxy-2-oxoglutarate aldolase